MLKRRAKFISPFKLHKSSTLAQKIGRSINLLGATIVIISASIDLPTFWYIIAALLQWFGPTISDLFTIEDIEDGQSNTRENTEVAS